MRDAFRKRHLRRRCCWIDPQTSEPGETGSTEETAMHKRNRRKTARRRASFKKKQKKRRERAAGKGR
jgi:hypothetical protein